MKKRTPKVGDEVLAFRPPRNAGSVAPHDPEWEGGMRCRVARVIEAPDNACPRLELAPIGNLQIGANNDFTLMTAAEAARVPGLTQWAELAGD